MCKQLNGPLHPLKVDKEPFHNQTRVSLWNCFISKWKRPIFKTKLLVRKRRLQHRFSNIKKALLQHFITTVLNKNFQFADSKNCREKLKWLKLKCKVVKSQNWNECSKPIFALILSGFSAGKCFDMSKISVGWESISCSLITLTNLCEVFWEHNNLRPHITEGYY